MTTVTTLPPLTRAMHDARIGALRALTNALKSNPPSSREEFADMMSATFRKGGVGIDVRELAYDMGYSVSSAYRWVEGRHSPHPSQWTRIVEWVVGRIDATIAEGATA